MHSLPKAKKQLAPEEKRDTRISRQDLAWASWKARQGWSQKRIAAALEVSPRTLRRHLRSSTRERSEAKGSSVVLAELIGSHRVHAAHVIMDLWELVHVTVVTGKQPTLADLSRIRGEWHEDVYRPQDEASTTRAFYRIKDMLDEQGVRWEKRVIVGEPSIRIEFEVAELAEFVRKEIDLAGRVIENFAKRTGMKRRFRGR